MSASLPIGIQDARGQFDRSDVHLNTTEDDVERAIDALRGHVLTNG